MLINCPLCGSRDLREFSVTGSADCLARPAEDADLSLWHDFAHLRDNPAGRNRELWHHAAGCGSWLVVERNTVTHEVYAVTTLAEAKA